MTHPTSTSIPACPSYRSRADGLALALLILAGCGDSDPPTVDGGGVCQVGTPFVTRFLDLGNDADGSDLVVRLLPPTGEGDCVSGYRAFVLPDGEQLSDGEAAFAVPTERTLQLPVGFAATTLDFGQIGVDGSGNEIVEGVAYRLQVVGFGEGDPMLATHATAVTLGNAAVVRTLAIPIAAGSGGMETDEAGNIYTADFGVALSGTPGTRIHRVTPAGEVSVFASGFQGASGNDRAANGDIFQSSIQGGTIHRVTSSGSVTTFATGLSGPVGIVALPGDTLIVAGCGDNTIRRVEPDGSVSTFSTSGLLNCPNGITRAPDGDYYIANFSDGAILRMTPQGSVSTLTQLPSGNAGHILWGRDALWVVDRRGNRLLRVSLEGDTATVAGTGQRGLDDGPALQATLSLPNDVAFSPDETRLYLNDVAQTTQPEGTISPVAVRALIFARPEGS